MSMSVSMRVSVYECVCVGTCENGQWKVCVCADSWNVWKLRIAAAAKDGQEIPPAPSKDVGTFWPCAWKSGFLCRCRCTPCLTGRAFYMDVPVCFSEICD